MRSIRSENRDWNLLIEETCDLITNLASSTIWPEDSLLRYYELMQLLMDNLKERVCLIDIANESLLSMHDRDNLIGSNEIYECLLTKQS